MIKESEIDRSKIVTKILSLRNQLNFCQLRDVKDVTSFRAACNLPFD